MGKKVHSNRGETLIEVLASILIASLSVTLLFTCVMFSSTKKYSGDEGVDTEYYDALAKAEEQKAGTAVSPLTPLNPKVTIKNSVTSGNQSFSIDIYGCDGGVYSYKEK